MRFTILQAFCLALYALDSAWDISAAEAQLGKTTLIGSDIPLLKGEFFGGIPYAEPPVGPLRLARPVPKFSLGNLSTFDAANFGDSCLQLLSPFANLPMSEDCLTINLFRPAGLSPRASLPVMAWIFGGSFFTGTTITFNASALVAQSITRGTPIIYLSFNYRLGPLGFPQGPEAEKRGVLNLGLRDQTLALEWVQANIAAFGGDPAKVTVFGQSAGAVSVGLLYLNHNFANLARAAIFESGQAGTTAVFDSNRSFPQWLVFVNNTASCRGNFSVDNTFPCLLAATSDEILAGETAGIAAMAGEFPFFPVLDGPQGIIPALPSQRLRSGAGGRIPFISGSVIDDGTLFVAASIAINSTAQIVDQLNSSFTPSIPSPGGVASLERAIDILLDLYPNIPALGCPFGTGNDTFGISPVFKRAAAIAGDLVIQAPRRFWSQVASSQGTNVFSYIFTDPQPENPPFLGVAHTDELPYVYGQITVAANGTGPGTLSKMMQDYWISFATSLDPNDGKGTHRPKWEAYESQKRILRLHSTNTEMIPDHFRCEQMAFINNNAELFAQ
ncbi:extracellular triacylglycerol lipase precursor [Mycena sp. CBHHK59/15]|nr:extracellular triacylglycerol lipase precursor [Mycena sp. CBHHK59/15]